VRSPLVVCLAVFAYAATVAAQKPSADAAGTIVKTSAPSMMAVARLLVEDTWNPILDQRVQASPAGAGWTSADPRWQKARAGLAARMTRLFERYTASGELAGHIQSEVGRIGAGKDLDAAIAGLQGPAGPALVRQQARQSFIVSAMTASPDGPAIASPEWNARFRELGRSLDERAGSALPPDDGTHAAEMEKLATGPAGQVLSRLWLFVVSNATRQMNTGMNLMLFDDQAAIEREIAGAASSGAPATAARPARDTFNLDRMATCQDSWLDWGADDTRVGAFRESFLARFKQNGNDPFFVPIASATVLGMKVTRVYSNTIGMARGFSVAVEAPFETARKNMEQAVGKPLTHCDTGDGMRTCELSIAEKKTVMLMADATGKEKTTLVGCFYFYEK
jgi:hypothetical protein